MQVTLTHKPPKKKAAGKDKLRALVAGWRARISTEPKTGGDLLNSLGYSGRESGWILKLASERSHLDALREFLNGASETEQARLKEELGDAVLDELLQFSRGLASNPTSARFTFSLEAARLEEIYSLLQREGLSDEIEEALCEFDKQVEARRQAVESRLSWKPSEPQRRVNSEVSSRKYEPGTPGWLTGRLNDAPEMLGQKLPREKAEQLVLELETSYYKYRATTDFPRSEAPEVSMRNTYFAQGLEPRVQFGQVGQAPGVEGYLKESPDDGPRVLEFPTEDGSFVYLMFDGHHRAAAQLLMGNRVFKNVTVMRMDDVESVHGHTEQDILDAIRDLHTHLFMTDAPVPR